MSWDFPLPGQECFRTLALPLPSDWADGMREGNRELRMKTRLLNRFIVIIFNDMHIGSVCSWVHGATECPRENVRSGTGVAGSLSLPTRVLRTELRFPANAYLLLVAEPSHQPQQDVFFNMSKWKTGIVSIERVMQLFPPGWAWLVWSWIRAFMFFHTMPGLFTFSPGGRGQADEARGAHERPGDAHKAFSCP